MGRFQVDTKGRMFFTKMGLRKTVPSSMERIVPLGLFHIFLRAYSTTRSWLGVIVAHLTPTPYRRMASAASAVTRSSVSSRCFTCRSKYSSVTSSQGKSSFSFTCAHMTRVISSPSISTMGVFTFIFSIAIPGCFLSGGIRFFLYG